MKNHMSGKLIITSYKDEKNHKNITHQVACFIAENKLEYIKVIPSEDTLPSGTILTGKVTNIVSNIPAAFVSMNATKEMGFLSLDNLNHAILINRKFNGKLQAGDEVLVKVVREPMKTKEATLTTILDMTSQYTVVRLGSGKLCFSQKLSGEEKELIFNFLVSKAIVTRDKKLIGLEDLDIIVRTDAGELVATGKLDYLVKEIESAVFSLRQMISQATMRPCYTVHQKPATWLNDVWNELHHCGYDIDEYVSDDFEMLKTLQELAEEPVRDKIRLYHDKMISLSMLYGIKEKIDELRHAKVWLPSGGYLVIEPTEAMIVIDVNSGKAIHKGDDKEALFYEVNKEAAYEIARQLRLRNLSGMVVVDFINMSDKSREEEIINCMKEASKDDFSIVTVYDFTKLGLLEMTRNKKRKPLHEVL